MRKPRRRPPSTLRLGICLLVTAFTCYLLRLILYRFWTSPEPTRDPRHVNNIYETVGSQSVQEAGETAQLAVPLATTDPAPPQSPLPLAPSPPPAEPTLRATEVEKISPAVLVVGGTDGSGTRRVVQILTDLGVRAR